MCKSINLENLLNANIAELSTNQLASQFLELKKALKCVQDQIYEIEAALHWKNIDDERLEGTINLETEEFKIKETRKLTKKIDAAGYALVKDLLGSFSPVKMKPELDAKLYKALEKANPEIFKLCQSFISVTPAKPYFIIEKI